MMAPALTRLCPRPTLPRSFGSSSTNISLLVEDTFQEGWPRVSEVNDTSLLLSANMSASSNWTVTAWVLSSAQLEAMGGQPSAADVEKNGLALQVGVWLGGPA